MSNRGLLYKIKNMHKFVMFMKSINYQLSMFVCVSVFNVIYHLLRNFQQVSFDLLHWNIIS